MGLLELLFGKKETKKETKKRIVSYHKKFHLRGINYECKKCEGMKRQEVLNVMCICHDTRVHLERYLYKNEPAYMVILDKNGLDIGVVPAEMVSTVEKYVGREQSLEVIRMYDFDDDRLGVELLFRVYKDE